MKTLLAILLFSFTASAQVPEMLLLAIKTPPAGATALLSEDFEGTGTPSGWTDRSPVNYDFNTTGLDMQGSHCMKPGPDGGSTTASFTGQDEAWLYCLIRVTNSPSDLAVLRFQDSGGVTVASVLMSETEPDIRPKVTSDTGHVSAATLSAILTNTTYYIKLHFKKGTGANALADLEFSVNGTFSGSGNWFVSVTDGAATAQTTKVFFYDTDPIASSWGVHFDRFSVWSSDQGNFPASP